MDRERFAECDFSSVPFGSDENWQLCRTNRLRRCSWGPGRDRNGRFLLELPWCLHSQL